MAMRARHSLRPLLRLRGGHGHAASESKAVLFGEEPVAAGSKRVWGDWEVYHYALIVGTAAIALAATQRSNTNPRDWARDEAEERERRRQAGLPVEYGVNYAGIRYLKERGVVDAETADALEGGAIPQSHKPATRFDNNHLA